MEEGFAWSLDIGSLDIRHSLLGWKPQMSKSSKGSGRKRRQTAPKTANGAAPTAADDIEAAVEAETHEIGRQLWTRLGRRGPSVFERRWWDDRILSWAMAD